MCKCWKENKVIQCKFNRQTPAVRQYSVYYLKFGKYRKIDTEQHNTTQHNTTQHNTTQHNTTQHNTTQYNTIQYNTIQYNTAQYNTIQYNTTHHNTTQHNTTQHNTIQYNTIQYNTIQYNTIQYNTIQYNTIQYNTIQYNTIQYNTIQYNTTQHNTTPHHTTPHHTTPHHTTPHHTTPHHTTPHHTTPHHTTPHHTTPHHTTPHHTTPHHTTLRFCICYALRALAIFTNIIFLVIFASFAGPGSGFGTHHRPPEWPSYPLREAASSHGHESSRIVNLYLTPPIFAESSRSSFVLGFQPHDTETDLDTHDEGICLHATRYQYFMCNWNVYTMYDCMIIGQADYMLYQMYSEYILYSTYKINWNELIFGNTLYNLHHNMEIGNTDIDQYSVPYSPERYPTLNKYLIDFEELIYVKYLHEWYMRKVL